MNDLFKKLNVLVKSSLNELRTGEERGERPRLAKNVEGEIASLRERINDAVKYEDEIKARIRQFEDEVARWDAQADEAVGRGDEARARNAIEQMRRARQRAASAEDDLREHERMTQELIQHVNTLDAVVADVRRSEETSEAAKQAEPPRQAEQLPRQTEQLPKPSAQLPDLGNVLREAREKIASLADTAAAQRELSEEAPPQPDEQNERNERDTAEVDDDLDRRRQRLSKR